MTTLFQRIKPFLLAPEMSERRIAGVLESIKETYTTKRTTLEEKKWSDKEVSAYASFYLPTNYQKFSTLMKQLPLEIQAQLSTCEVIDFGTGPGTYLIAYIDYFGSKKASKLIGIDKDRLMLSQAESLLLGLFPEAKNKISLINDTSFIKSEDSRLLIFGNSLNELSVDKVKDIITHFDPQYILFIEPGTPTVFDSMTDMRKWLAQQEFACFYPCPSIKHECPVAKRVSEGQEDWCHQVWRGVHDEEVERLGQIAKIDRRTMPFIGHFYGKSEVQSEVSQVRFMRFINESKHSFDWEVCLLGSEGLSLLIFEIPKRGLSKADQKYMKKISVGENFSYEVMKKLSDKRWRVSISF